MTLFFFVVFIHFFVLVSFIHFFLFFSMKLFSDEVVGAQIRFCSSAMYDVW